VIDRLVVLGAAGDLATRHLLAALSHLARAGGLPADFRILGVDRAALTTDTYRERARGALTAQAPTVGSLDRADLVRRLDYRQADLSQQPDLGSDLGAEPVIAYLALPPSAYPSAVRALSAAGLAPGSRVVIEKPFGEDRTSARELTALLHSLCLERDVFRADHFLHHQSVQDLLALRFANPFFEPMWNCEHLERVEITWEETAGVAGRAGYYDRVGALRDMVQSHLLQLLALVAMDAPATFDEHGLRDAKVAALRRVRSFTADEVATQTARGRYTSGRVQDQPRNGYLDEPGVDPARGTETHACLQVMVVDHRWAGVPFVLRTGKALGRARRRISLHFRASAGLPSATPAVLTVDMAPDRVWLQLNGAGPPGLPALSSLRLEATRPAQPLPASARLLRDVLAGDPTFAVRDDETEQCWRIVDSVLAGWQTGAPPLQDYAAGSAGPAPPIG